MWIPVSERLPNNNVRVLCCATGKSISGGYTRFVGCCNNGFWFVQTNAETVSFPGQYEVTAWMPLPEPYKAGGSMDKEQAIYYLLSSGFSPEQIKNIEKAFSHYVPIVTPLAPHQKIMTHIISDIQDYEKNCVSCCSDSFNCVECLKTVFENIYSIFDRYNREGGME